MTIQNLIDELIDAGRLVLDSDFDPDAFKHWRFKAFECLSAMLGPNHIHTKYFEDCVAQRGRTTPISSKPELFEAKETVAGNSAYPSEGGDRHIVSRHVIKERPDTLKITKFKGEQVMSKVGEIRESIDKKLDHWEATVTALEEQLEQTEQHAQAVFELRRKKLDEALDKFKSEVARAKGITEEKKKDIEAHFEDLQVQLALGKAEARDAVEAQMKKIRHSIATLEATVDRHLDAVGNVLGDSFDSSADKFVAAAIEYEAAMKGLEARLLVKKVEASADFENKKEDFLTQISNFKAQLHTKRQMAKEKAATFEKDLSNGMSQIEQAFKKLLG